MDGVELPFSNRRKHLHRERVELNITLQRLKWYLADAREEARTAKETTLNLYAKDCGGKVLQSYIAHVESQAVIEFLERVIADAEESAE